jgi:hypothetical protein
MTAMGCVDQYMLMDRVSGQYTNYSSVLDIQNQIFNNPESWNFSHRQVAALETISWVVGQVAGIGGILQALGAGALRAKKLVQGSISNPLPSNQWTIEAGYRFDIGLTMTQRCLSTLPPVLRIQRFLA